MQASHQARLVLSAEPPYGITYTNEAWTALMGHSPEQAKMFPFTLMNVSQVKRSVEENVPAAAACCPPPLFFVCATIAAVHPSKHDIRWQRVSLSFLLPLCDENERV